MRAVPTGHPPGLGHYGGAGTALTDLGGRDRLCVEAVGDKGTPQEPRQHLVTLARAERPQGPAVCAKGRQLQAGTTEGSGGGPGAGSCSCDSRGRCRQGPGDPGCSAWLPAFLRARLRGASRKPGHHASGHTPGERRDHVTRPIPAAAAVWAWPVRMCRAAVGCVLHTGLCHPRNVFDQEFLPRGGKPRATNPFPQSRRPAPSPEPRRQ